MNKDYIKQIIKEMVDEGEIVVRYDLYLSKQSQDSFGNSCGPIEDIDLEICLEIPE